MTPVTRTRSSARPPRALRRAAALLAGLGVLLGLLLATAAPASAHAALIRTDPADGSVVRTAPQRVVLTFSEGVLLSADSLRVLDPRGTDVAAGAPGHANGPDSGATATVALRPGLGNGTYTVAWRAISQDSHPVGGAFTFSIGSPSRTTVDLSGVASAGDPVAGTLYGVGRYFAYGGFALLVGAAVFLSVCWPRGALLRPMQLMAATGWVTLLASTIALLLLRGPYVNGKGPGQIVDLGVIRDQLETRPGAALLSRLLLLAAAAVFLAVLFGPYAKREDPEERADLAWGLGIGGTVVAVGIAATWAMAEHASVGLQHQVAMPVDVIHLLSMAVWLGGLLTLLVALWAPAMAGTPVPPFAVRRFSLLALTAITLLIGTGIYQAWRQMGSWRAFPDTSYGRLLLIKIGLVCALVAVAWFSRRWTARLGRPGATAAGVAAAKAGGAGAAADGRKSVVKARTAGRAAGVKARTAGRAAGVKARTAGRAAGVKAGTGAASGKGAGADAVGAATDDRKVLAAGAGGNDGAPVAAGTGGGRSADGKGGTSTGAAGSGPSADGKGSRNGGTPEAGAGGDAQVGAGTGANGTGAGADSSGAGKNRAGGPTAATAADGTGAGGGASSGGKGGKTGGADDPVRAAQLRRQRAARSAAQVKKAREADPARGGLRRTVLAEAVVAVVLLAVTTMLSGSQPGRAAEEQKGLAAAPAPSSSTAGPEQIAVTLPYDTGGANGKGVAGVTVAPGRAGTPNEVHLLLTSGKGVPVDVPEVRLAFTLPARHLGPIPVTLKRIDTGHWTATGVQLPLPGTWQMTVTVRTSDIDETTVAKNVEVGS